MDKGIVVPLALFFAVVFVIKLLVDARMRYLFFQSGSPEVVAALFAGEEKLRRTSSLRWGLVLTCLALGLAIATQAQWSAFSLPGLAVLLGAAGIGNLLAFGLQERLSKASRL
jgi:hypothetical protein